jgi:hypothetical protein
MTHEQAIKLLNIPSEDYYELLQSFKPSLHKIITKDILESEEEDEEDEEICEISYIHIDGDGGAVYFQGHSEIFEEEGITISLIDCTYCDMPTNTVLEIYEGILLGDTDE